MSKTLTRDILYSRHHLSHQQIDDFLLEEESARFPELKGQMLGKLNDFLAVTQLFSGENIFFIPFKGPLLSYRLYNDATYRYYTDLDFLLKVSEVQNAVVLLIGNGFILQNSDWDHKQQITGRLLKYNNQLSFYHPDKNIRIELHWNLIKYRICSPDILNELIASNQKQIGFAGKYYQVLNNELELLYLIIHGGLHAWQWLKWLVDIHDFIKNIPFNHEKFNQLVKQLNAGNMVALCNALLITYFPETPLLPQSEKASGFLVNYSLFRIQSESETVSSFIGKVKFHWFRMRCFPGIKYKISVISHLLFRPSV